MTTEGSVQFAESLSEKLARYTDQQRRAKVRVGPGWHACLLGWHACFVGR